MRRGLILLIGVFLLALPFLALFGGWQWLKHYAVEPGPLTQETAYLLEFGTPSRRMADELEQAGIIHHADAFYLLNRLHALNGSLQAGEYLFPAGVAPQQILDKMTAGDVIVRKLTIPEGLTALQVKALVNAAEGLVGESPPIVEGSVLPETYTYSRGYSREAMVKRMQKAHDDLVKELWPGRKNGIPVVTPEEAVTLASIVEKETGLEAERGRVAAVFSNRLRIGMPLQADPTVSYGITQGALLDRKLTTLDLQTPNPYNTYLNRGLPPTPIANPGRASIAAVLNPPETKELYFVATGNGGHWFAETLDQHNRNVQQYRQTLRSQAAP